MTPTLTLPTSPARETGSPAVDTRPSRWLYVVSHTDPRYGGLSSAVPALAATLSAQQALDIDLAAFCLPGEEHRPIETPADAIQFWPTSRAAWATDGKWNKSFGALVRQVDGLHVHGLWEQSTAAACRAARQQGKPYVLSAHGMLEPWALATKRLKKQIYAALIERANVTGANCLHALTVAEAAQYRAFGARGPIAVVPNAVDLPEQADPSLLLDSFPELGGRRLILFLSRLHPKKGLDLLVGAWSRLASAFPDAHLVIAGPDAEGMQAKLSAEAAQHGIADRLTFTGMLTGAMKWSALAAAEAYVLPSYSEGLSMALLEAMGMGLPVIATRTCNMPEITVADAGWEIDATVDALASAMGDLLTRTPAENEEKGHRGAKLIAERYSPAQVARQMAEVYRFVLHGQKPATVSLLTGGAL